MRVLITTDGSEPSYEAVRQFIQLTHPTRHHVTVLCVMPSLTVGRSDYMQIEQEREGISALNTAASILSGAAIHAETSLKQGTPADVILETAREGNYDLIVMGRRGRGGFREFLLGSVSKAIVHHAPCAILIGK